jgi:hypothetical protein
MKGSRDRGIPLLVTKCLGMMQQVVSDYGVDSIYPLFNGKKELQNAADVRFVQELKVLFDDDDESVDLLGIWQTKRLTPTAFACSLASTLIEFFNSIPTKVIPPSVVFGVEKQLQQFMRLAETCSEDSNRSSDDGISLVPLGLMKGAIINSLSILPESHYQTLRKVIDYLRRWYLGNGRRNRKQLALQWQPAIFGDQSEATASLLEILIERSDVIFAATSPKVAPASLSSFEKEEDRFPVDVFLHDQVYSNRIPKTMTVRQLCAEIVQEKQLACAEGFTIFEVLPDGSKRHLHEHEVIFVILTNWTSPKDHRLVFEHSAYFALWREMDTNSNSVTHGAGAAGITLLRGWLHKEVGRAHINHVLMVCRVYQLGVGGRDFVS